MNRGAFLNPAGFVATQDLKDRGWTPRLIAEFLGQHDQTRPNGLKMGGRRLPPVKLYRESRVEEAEREERFLLAQHRAMQARERLEAARAERQARRAARLNAAAEAYRPQIVPELLRKGAIKKARDPYLNGVEQVLDQIRRGFAAESPEVTPRAPKSGKPPKASNPRPLTESEEKDLRADLMRRLDTALAVVYPWFPDPDEVEAKKAGRTKTGQAKPADWRKWDWD
ncbi:hypothetical protein [Deinococcus alpinitundrae]|uniref:hypothetical protein n=1 Tax=Deinococcus alpinitundrae TaxID=468913 RepID=UPI00137A7F82|nr:hypothetical protein [Deinococcus alpinitundrae]